MNRAPVVHTFDSTGEAYDASQCNEAIRSGDVLHVPSEGVVGILCEAWPVAVTAAHGAFHQLAGANNGLKATDPQAAFSGLMEADWTASVALALETMR
jgi:hypothetical protein